MRKYLLKQLFQRAWPAISLMIWILIIGLAGVLMAEDLFALWRRSL